MLLIRYIIYISYIYTLWLLIKDLQSLSPYLHLPLPTPLVSHLSLSIFISILVD